MRRIAVFAKRPFPGRVKTRLSPSLPEAMARDLYQAMLADALTAAAGCDAGESFVFWATENAGVAIEPTGAPAPGGMAERVQRGDDLGARLATAFGELLRAADDRAVIIGADCPMLASDALDRAFFELEAHELVLGPTRDGGYYLIGLRRPWAPLFEGVAWSTERVLGQTLERADLGGLDTVLLGKRDDLDTPEDLTSVLAAAASGAAIGSATARSLRTMGLLPAAR